MGASVRTATVDWPRIILDLRGKGMPRHNLARRVGVSPNTISAYQSGQTREPPYSVGAAILDLHARMP